LNGLNICLQNEQFIENRMIAGLAMGPDGLIHNVIHSSCGYREKMNEIRGLGAPRPLGVPPNRWPLHRYAAEEQRNGHKLYQKSQR
jgi:hypothetical protein